MAANGTCETNHTFVKSGDKIGKQTITQCTTETKVLDGEQEEFPVHVSELVKGGTKKGNRATKITRQQSLTARPSINARRGKLNLSLSVDQADSIYSANAPSLSPRRKWKEKEPFTFDEADLSYLERKENPLRLRNRSGSSSQALTSSSTSPGSISAKDLGKKSRCGSVDSNYKVNLRNTKRSQGITSRDSKPMLTKSPLTSSPSDSKVTLRKSLKNKKHLLERTPSAEDFADIKSNAASVKRCSVEATTLSVPTINGPQPSPGVIQKQKIQSKILKSATFVVNSPSMTNNVQEKKDTSAFFKFPDVNTSRNETNINQVKSSSSIDTDEDGSDDDTDIFSFGAEAQNSNEAHQDHGGKASTSPNKKRINGEEGIGNHKNSSDPHIATNGKISNHSKEKPTKNENLLRKRCNSEKLISKKDRTSTAVSPGNLNSDSDDQRDKMQAQIGRKQWNKTAALLDSLAVSSVRHLSEIISSSTGVAADNIEILYKKIREKASDCGLNGDSNFPESHNKFDPNAGLPDWNTSNKDLCGIIDNLKDAYKYINMINHLVSLLDVLMVDKSSPDKILESERQKEEN
ncbi:hypothetical protein TrispH2_003294 [Trichoplax sp. H2]|nr:hypothetical protein TrispH2_003294 [Trichoplax sp. H2]|eukprot:RDD44269.1 hypothetical protein TrispH2_003294 [Trichoplax sp. H2]